MEVIHQRVNYIDGVPTYKAGEWPGIKSSRWRTGSKQILKPLETISRNGFESIYFFNFPVISGGRKHYNTALSSELSFRPRVKVLPNRRYTQDEPIKRGMKYIDPKYSEQKIYEKKDLSYVIKIKESSPQCTKQFPDKIKQCTEEFGVEKVIGKKKRLPHLEFVRNGMPIISPGDKHYKNVEYSPDFFKLEGLVVGSTNKEHFSKSSAKKGDNFFDSLNLKIKVLDERKLWRHKLLRESLENDNNYVGKLDNWEETYLKPLLNEDNIISGGKGNIAAGAKKK